MLIFVLCSFTDPLTTPNAVYGIAVEGSNHIKTVDNPVYGARIDAY